MGKQLSIELDVELHKLLKLSSIERGTSMNAIVVELIEESLSERDGPSRESPLPAAGAVSRVDAGSRSESDPSSGAAVGKLAESGTAPGVSEPERAAPDDSIISAAGFVTPQGREEAKRVMVGKEFPDIPPTERTTASAAVEGLATGAEASQAEASATRSESGQNRAPSPATTDGLREGPIVLDAEATKRVREIMSHERKPLSAPAAKRMRAHPCRHHYPPSKHCQFGCDD